MSHSPLQVPIMQNAILLMGSQHFRLVHLIFSDVRAIMKNAGLCLMAIGTEGLLHVLHLKQGP